jgi:hypothetical protein
MPVATPTPTNTAVLKCQVALFAGGTAANSSADGFWLQIKNFYNFPDYVWAVNSSAGVARIDSVGIVTVTKLNNEPVVTVTITTTGFGCSPATTTLTEYRKFNSTPTATVDQAALTISNATTSHLASSTQWVGLTTTGGSGTGAVTYSASGTGCSISGQSLKSEVATTCIVTASKAASTGFNAVTSAAKSFRFVNADQASLAISNTVLTSIPGSSITLTYTGGSGSGVVNYSVSGTDCSVSGSSLTASAATTCVVTATKAASTGYNSATSTTKSFVFVLPNQTPTPDVTKPIVVDGSSEMVSGWTMYVGMTPVLSLEATDNVGVVKVSVSLVANSTVIGNFPAVLYSGTKTNGVWRVNLNFSVTGPSGYGAAI